MLSLLPFYLILIFREIGSLFDDAAKKANCSEAAMGYQRGQVQNKWSTKHLGYGAWTGVCLMNEKEKQGTYCHVSPVIMRIREKDSYSF